MNTEKIKSLLQESNKSYIKNNSIDECVKDISGIVLRILQENLYNEIRNSNSLLEEIAVIIKEKTGLNLKTDTQPFIENYDKIFDGIIKNKNIVNKQELENFIKKTVK